MLSGRSTEGAFAPITKAPAVKRALSRGARVAVMPALTCMAQVTDRGLTFEAAMNGVAITTSSEVEKLAHTSSGIRKKLIPGARIVMIVTRKLSAVRNSRAKNTAPTIARTMKPMSPICLMESAASWRSPRARRSRCTTSARRASAR